MIFCDKISESKNNGGDSLGVLGSAVTGVIAFKIVADKIGKANGNNELGFNGNVEIRQNIKGRLRLSSPFLKNKEQGYIMVTQLSKVDGINKVGSDYRTGSILIEYDDSKVEGELLIGAIIKMMGFDGDSKNSPQSLVMKEIHIANQAINMAILDKTKGILDLRTIVPLTFLGLAVKSYANTGNMGLPAPVTLLYWSYKTLELGKGGSTN